MPDLSNQEVQALGHAVGLDIQDPELTEVAYSLNAILELMAEIDLPSMNALEPLPITLPSSLRTAQGKPNLPPTGGRVFREA